MEEMIDQKVLANLRNLKVLPRLIHIFLTDSPARLAAVREAIVCEDAAALSRLAHGLRGMCANMGVLRMTQGCAELEVLAANGDLRSALGLVDGLFDELSQIRSRLELERARA